jgi:hypothetical protein
MSMSCSSPSLNSALPVADSLAAADLQEQAPSRQVVLPFRFVLTGMLVGLLWKVSFFRSAVAVYAAIPLHDGFFPVWLQQATTLRLAFLVAVASIVMAGFAQLRQTRCVAMAISWLACTVLLIHQGTYNDMTFTTVWWCNVWALWYAWRMDIDPVDQLRPKAAFLSRLMISVVLLGGAVGKWTGEYWSGEVFYEIYFRDRDFWVFNALRSWLDPESLRWAAMAYSRKVIVIETLGGLGIWLLPARWAAVAGVVIFASIALLSNFLLFSVLGPLIALSLAGWYQRRQPSASPIGGVKTCH